MRMPLPPRIPRGALRIASAGALASIVGCVGALAGRAAEPASPSGFGFADVQAMARALAAAPFAAPNAALPATLERLDYDSYRAIRFRPEKALWRGERLFEVQFFHRGFLYRQPVHIRVVENGRAREIGFRRQWFDYRQSGIDADALGGDLGFAGFRLHYPLHGPAYKDEVAVFLGASYFRLLGRGQRFGVSARGLAIDTAMPGGEEFPFFKAFWLVAPDPEQTTMTLYALLDSPRVAGAYRFVITPGSDTVAEVTAKIFARGDVARLGIAPMTSMFLYGENRTRRFDDYRPEVHDSDGLQMQTGAGEWIWRPLSNDRKLRVTAFLERNPRGFGLVQRDRDFDHSLDVESRFDRRPSYWVEPLAEWGGGAVQLVEIPSQEEINDNIVAFWTPEQPFKAGDSLRFAYRLHAYLQATDRPPLGRAVRTRIGSAAIPGHAEKPPPDVRLFVVDFAGGELSLLAADEPVEAKIAASSGKVSEVVIEKIPVTGAWRAFFRIDPDGDEAMDMDLTLRLRGAPLTETWKYLWTP